MTYLLTRDWLPHPTSTSDGTIAVVVVQPDVVEPVEPPPPRTFPRGLGELHPHPCFALGHALSILKELERDNPQPAGLRLSDGEVLVLSGRGQRWRRYDWREIAWETRTWSAEDWGRVDLWEPGQWAIEEMKRRGLWGNDRLLPVPGQPSAKLRAFLRDGRFSDSLE